MRSVVRHSYGERNRDTRGEGGSPNTTCPFMFSSIASLTRRLDIYALHHVRISFLATSPPTSRLLPFLSSVLSWTA